MEWRWRILLVSLHVISTAPFSCDNNQRTFPLHYLNDDYCDCMDGSDETTTAACSHVQQSLKVMFTCTDTRTVQTIPTSMVNDGVCDCCDGSDEMVVSCPLICKHKLYTLRKEMSNFAKTQAVGAITNTKLLYGGTGKKNERTVSVVQGHFLKYKEAGLLQYNTDILKKQTELKQVRDYIHQSIKKLQHDGHEIDPSNPTARVDPRALQYYAMTKQHLDVLHYHVSMLTTLSENDLGPNLQYLHLLTNGTCYPSPVINEKRLKGGTPNVIPQLYQFEFCPFKHVTQFEINHTFWETNEKLIKAGLPIVNELPKNVLEQLGIGLPLTETTIANIQVSGNLHLQGPKGHITASKNISASGLLYASTSIGNYPNVVVQDTSTGRFYTTASTALASSTTQTFYNTGLRYGNAKITGSLIISGGNSNANGGLL